MLEFGIRTLKNIRKRRFSLGKHRKTKKEQFEDLLDEIKNKTNRNNVDLVIPLMTWVSKKIDLIVAADNFKKSVRLAKQQGKPKPRPLLVSRGEIWQCELGQNVGSEQNESRPVLIIQNDVNNKLSPNTIIAPLTSLENRSNNNQPLTQKEIEEIRSNLRATEVLLLPTDVKKGEKKTIAKPSILMCQNIREINKERLEFRITQIDETLWEKIDKAIKSSLGLD